MLFSKATSVAYVEQEIVEQLRGFFGGAGNMEQNRVEKIFCTK